MLTFLSLFLSLILFGCGGTKGEKGDAGSTGQTGTTGQNGATGMAGTNGTSGNTGPGGNPGTPGTIVSTIQFCPGTTTIYPNVFPEFGIVINNEIYAVFTSNGNNFLAKIVPGNYVSTATGLQCNFTVLSGGVLQ